MMAIPFREVSLTRDEAAKSEAATRQTRELIERLQVAIKYRTLAQSDRELLLNEGYAAELVDNLAFFTQRFPSRGLGRDSYKDEVVTGYSYAAFDPSVYASNSIMDNLRGINQGRCAYCESCIDASGSGGVYHFRPAWILQNAQKPYTTLRSPYYDQAYRQDNLLYSCKTCSEEYKQDIFAVVTNTAANNEAQPLLLNPYVDSPREFIRFNPANGFAYAYDVVKAYLAFTKQVAPADLESAIYADPSLIPMGACAGSGAEEEDERFSQWAVRNHPETFRGYYSIMLLGLNRRELVDLRGAHINQLQRLFQSCADSPVEASLDDTAYLDQWQQQLGDIRQYLSLSIDALKTWSAKQQDQQLDMDAFNLSFKPLKSAPFVASTRTAIPSWLASSLIYLVLESELSVKDKRRIICISSRDYLYGSDNDEKCVFLSIDWKKDIDNVIKVRSQQHTWETSFQELANTRPLELINLFAGNEVWAEGDYPALADE